MRDRSGLLPLEWAGIDSCRDRVDPAGRGVVVAQGLAATRVGAAPEGEVAVRVERPARRR